MEQLWAFAIICLAASQALLGVVLLVQVWQSSKIKGLTMGLVDDLNAVKNQLAKARSEITLKVFELEAALVSAGADSDAVNDAVSALKDVAQGLDDIVPDSPPALVVPVDPAATPVKAGDLDPATTVVEVPASNGPAEVPFDGVPVDAGAIHPESWVTPVAEIAPVEPAVVDAPADAPVVDAPADSTEDVTPKE